MAAKLLCRERHGIATSVHVALTSLMERTSTREDILAALSEIAEVVDVCLRGLETELLSQRQPPAATRSNSLVVYGKQRAQSIRGRRINLPDSIVHRILDELCNLCISPSERRQCVFRASSTNRQWRSVARSRCWFRLDDLSQRELAALPQLFKLAALNVLLVIDLDMSLGDPIAIHRALSDQLVRVRVLKLRRAVLGPGLLLPAPKLEQLLLAFENYETLPPTLFERMAPHLVNVELADCFPAFTGCPYEALKHVKRLRATISDRPEDRPIRVDDLRRAFPKLVTLVFDKMRGIKSESAQGFSSSRWSLARLEVHEADNKSITQPFVALMPKFGHDNLEYIHIVRGAPNSITFFKRRIDQVRRVFVLSSASDEHCVVAITDERHRTRMFSQCSGAAIFKVLKFADIFQGLTELALWEYLHDPHARELTSLEFPLVDTFIIFVRGFTEGMPEWLFSKAATVHLFSLAGLWRMPAIRELRLTAVDVTGADLFGPPMQRPMVPHQRLTVFARQLSRRRRLERLELHQVGLDDDAFQLLDEVAHEVSIS